MVPGVTLDVADVARVLREGTVTVGDPIALLVP
jgi:hypothetical protein